MRLSALQKYILEQCLLHRYNTIPKKIVEAFYHDTKVKPKNIISDITKSVDRLIMKDLVVGIGKKTSHKWLINQVTLTPQGKKIARDFFGKQQKLPLKIKL